MTRGQLAAASLFAAIAASTGCGKGDSSSGAGPAFTSNFTGSETPISEGGAWRHIGQDWTFVVKGDGLAHGTQDGAGTYNDSYAYLSGFPPNQSASATIFLNPTTAVSSTREFEILLRWSDLAHSATGYECNLQHQGGYAQIVRWNGPFGDFTVLTNAAKPPKPKTGDVMTATIVGNVIKVFLNGSQFMQATDSTHATGNPGMGFFIGTAGTPNDDFGFTSFTATGL